MRHPIVGFLAGVALVRVCGLTLHCFGHDPGGRPLAASPLNALAIAVTYHLAAIAMLAVALLVVARVVPRANRWVTRVAGAAFAASAALGQIDLGLLRYIGQHFSPSIARTYVGDGMMTTALWQPLVFDWRYVLQSVGLIALGWVLIAIVWRRTRGDQPMAPVSWRQTIVIAAMATAGLVAVSRMGSQRLLFQPPEVGLLPLLAGDATPEPVDEAATRRTLQRWLDPSGTAEWLDPRYPLIHRPPPAADGRSRATDPPDVVLVMVESLRGRDVGYQRVRKGPSLTPNLDRLASRAVQFPWFIANGFPTAPGFFSLNTALWSHRSSIMTSHFTGTHVDALPRRLAALGYHTVWIHGANPSFDNQLRWANLWYDETVYDLPENSWLYVKRMNDQVLMRRAADIVAHHDATSSRVPLFLFLSTAGMHPPFTLGDSLFEPLSAMGDASRMDTMSIADPQRRYDLVLSAFDRAFGGFLDALDRRPRRDNTVMIVTGDHSSATNDPLAPELRGMPTDETMWTTALISGPPDLVGSSPRTETFAASHVDVMPTVLAMVGDRGPTAAMGRDLLDGWRDGRSAVAVRPAGYRLDRDGQALLVSGEGPDRWWVFTPFGATTTTRPNLDGSGFSDGDVKDLRDLVNYVSYLIERDRIWPRR